MTALRNGDKNKITKMAKDLKELSEQHGTVTEQNMLQRGHSIADLNRLGDQAREKLASSQ